jgi:secreted PhoX family phosphatase
VGQTFVLSVDAFATSGGNAALNYNQGANATATRFGAATWVPLTNLVGVPLPGVPDPFLDGLAGSPTLGGRAAADFVGGTPYGRPEDMIVSRLANGNEVLYVATTSEQAVISIEITNPGKAGRFPGTAIVRTYVSNSGTPKNDGFAATTAVLNSPDNLALDAAGNIYVIEDAPNGDNAGGDIWFVRDINNDGVGDSLDHFLSIRADGCEATGMIFNPAIPTEFIVAVQHPDSTNLTNVPNGLGDAVWSFNLSGISNTGFVQALNKGAFRFITNQ